MARFSELNTLVAPYAPNVPAFTSANAIREACRQFFKQVHAYQVEDVLGITQGVYKYELDAPENETEIVSLLGVKFNDFDVLAPMQSMPSHSYESKPTHYIGQYNHAVALHPRPKQAGTLTVTVALRPSVDAGEINDRILNENQEAIRFGALAILKRQVNTEWHSPDEVTYYQSLFDQAINEKRIQLNVHDVTQQTSMPIGRFI